MMNDNGDNDDGDEDDGNVHHFRLRGCLLRFSQWQGILMTLSTESIDAPESSYHAGGGDGELISEEITISQWQGILMTLSTESIDAPESSYHAGGGDGELISKEITISQWQGILMTLSTESIDAPESSYHAGGGDGELISETTLDELYWHRMPSWLIERASNLGLVKTTLLQRWLAILCSPVP